MGVGLLFTNVKRLPMIQSEIVERQPGYTNRAMVEYCELLLNIVISRCP